MFLNRAFIVLSVFMLSSCIPEEEAVEAFDRGDLSTVQLELGTRFSNMTFYSLSEQRIVDECELDAFDVYLSQDGIDLNPSRMMRAAITDVESFDDINDTTGLDFHFDASNGKKRAILESGSVYVIDMGITWDGLPIGLMKFRYTDLGSSYKLEFREFDASAVSTIEVEKEQYYSLLRNESYELVYPADYDLLFTRYPEYFAVEGVHYMVTGALIGSCEVMQVDGTDFESLDYDFYENNADQLTTELDLIGYDWKDFDFDASFYRIEENRSYIIKDSKDFVYKMRFTSYYNSDGVSGHPSFEYLLL